MKHNRRVSDLKKNAKVVKYHLLTVAVILAVLVITGCTSTPYAKVGAGYKVQETNMQWCDDVLIQSTCTDGNHPVSARFELGFESGDISYGLSHDSQFFSGAPFNDEQEYSKTEFFVDYKFTWE